MDLRLEDSKKNLLFLICTDNFAPFLANNAVEISELILNFVGSSILGVGTDQTSTYKGLSP